MKNFLKVVKHEEPKREPEPPKGAPVHDESNWLVSYADMMTLLCGFFIMLFSMASLDEPKYESMKAEIAKQFGGEYSSPTQELASFVTRVLEESGTLKGALIKSDPSGVSIAFQSTVFFDTLGSDVKPEGKKVLESLISTLSARQTQEKKEYRIVVEGHTDSRPITGGVYPSNWELSGARAARVIRMFLERGFTSDHLTAIGYADTHPQVPSRTPAGAWDEDSLAKNRRVVIRILQPTVDSIPFPEKAIEAAPAQNSSSNPPSP